MTILLFSFSIYLSDQCVDLQLFKAFAMGDFLLFQCSFKLRNIWISTIKFHWLVKFCFLRVLACTRIHKPLCPSVSLSVYRSVCHCVYEFHYQRDIYHHVISQQTPTLTIRAVKDLLLTLSHLRERYCRKIISPCRMKNHCPHT